MIGPSIRFELPAGASPELFAAVDSARAGAATIRAAFGRSIEFREKADSSPVTEIDLAAERAIRTILSERFPADAALGEEFGLLAGTSGRTWVIDPLDGTKNFLSGLPFVSTQVALFDGGRFRTGASAAPQFEEIAYADRGTGAFRNGRRLRVSEIARLERASLSFGNVKSLARSDRWSSVGELIARAARCRGYGDFFHYHALAAGQLDVVIESDVSIYDVAALAAIVEEAGGRATRLDGEPLDLESRTILATNGRLHDAVLDVLRRGSTGGES